jgi:hypothetical protein
MNIRYLFIRIQGNTSELTAELKDRFCFTGDYYFESRPDPSQYRLGYDHLFEEDAEYTAFARVDQTKQRLEIKSDYWNILPHYIYQQNGVLVLSNDAILIARLTHSPIAQEAIDDCLIFGRPYRSGSYFRNIRKLSSCESGYLDLAQTDSCLVTKDYPYWRQMLDKYQDVDIADKFYQDFQNAVSKIGGEKVTIQFSGGSDSMTILSACRHFGISYRCASHTVTPSIDHYIREVCNRLKLNNEVYVVPEDDPAMRRESVRLSNGLTPTSRFTGFYHKLAPCILFDGYNIFTENYSDAFIHPVLQELYKGNKPVGYTELSEQSNRRLFENCFDRYGDLIQPVDTAEGFKLFQDYMTEYSPQNVLGSTIVPAMQLGHRVNSYFMTLPYALGYFNNGFGLSKNVNIQKGYSRTKSNGKKPLGLIAAKLDPQIYNYTLDSLLSLREYKLWPRWDTMIKYFSRKHIKVVKAKITPKTNSIEVKDYPLVCFTEARITRNKRLAYLDLVLSDIRDMTV